MVVFVVRVFLRILFFFFFFFKKKLNFTSFVLLVNC